MTTLFSIAFISNHAQFYFLTSPDGNLNAGITIDTNASLELSNRNEKLLRLDEIDLVAGGRQLEGMSGMHSTRQSDSNH